MPFELFLSPAGKPPPSKWPFSAQPSLATWSRRAQTVFSSFSAGLQPTPTTYPQPGPQPKGGDVRDREATFLSLMSTESLSRGLAAQGRQGDMGRACHGAGPPEARARRGDPTPLQSQGERGEQLH